MNEIRNLESPAAAPNNPPPAEAMPKAPAPHGRTATRAQRIGLLIGLAVVAWLALDLFASVLLPFVAAGGIAYVLHPPTTWLTRLGLPRGLTTGLMILGFVAAVLLFVLLLYPLILAQIGILISRVPQYVFLVQAWAQEMIVHLQERFGNDVVDDRLRDLVGGQAGAVVSFLVRTSASVISGGLALFNVLTLMIVTPVVAVYLLRDWPDIVRMVDGWLPHRYAGLIRAQAREVDRILSAWVRGQALCCVFLALYYSMALSFVGLDLGLIVGLTAGLLSFIPYVGSIVGGLSAIGLAMAQFPDWHGVAWVVGVLAVGQTLEGYVLYPRFLGDRVELSAVWVIFALFAGGAAFGFVGVMLAVPIAAIIGVLCRFWLRRYLASPLYLDPPYSPETEPEPPLFSDLHPKA
jgi:predicted PurR-regulated permease PerM